MLDESGSKGLVPASYLEPQDSAAEAHVDILRLTRSDEMLQAVGEFGELT